MKHTFQKIAFLSFFLLLMMELTVAQANTEQKPKGKIIGKILDKVNNDPIIGAIVLVDGTTIGVQTNFDGQYELNLPQGSYKILVKYVAYNTKSIDGVMVTSGKSTTLNVAMEENSKAVSEVVITSTYKRESLGSLYTIQKNNIAISDGISSDIIKRSPDRNTSDVLKRVSGASIQDNKFVVIRGLSDRYNVALINGSPLPSTEPDRRAFAFDIFPSNLLDNLTVTKAATPDLPGDFAGGVIQLNTKDFPDEPFLSVTVGSNYNDASTGKAFYQNSTKGKYDFFGIDDGSRNFVKDLPAREDFPSSVYKTAAITRTVKNDWGYEKQTAIPGSNFQMLYGSKTKIAGRDAGLVAGVTYNNTYRFNRIQRQDFDNDGRLFNFKDDNYRNNVAWGAIANASYQIGENSKISFKNILSINTDNNTVLRDGYDLLSGQSDTVLIKAYSYEYVSKKLLSSQLNFDKQFANQMKWRVNAGYSKVLRDEPNSRTLAYSKAAWAPESPYLVQIGQNPDKNSRKFYSKLNEDNYSLSSDLTIPFDLMGDKSIIKTGVWTQQRSREFDARFFAYKQLGFGLTDSMKSLDPSQIFDIGNLQDTVGPLNGFILQDITNPTANYSAKNNLNAAYILFDSRINKKVRLVWGARVESNNVTLTSSTGQTVVDTTNIDILPSVNFTYAINEKANLRLAYSKTVSRPEFRELAPFEFEDFITNTLILGNPNLKRALINNFDVRYELYPTAGEIISATAFYKNFKDPIEAVYLGGSNRTKSFLNVKSAVNYGIELEFRKKLNFLNNFNALAWEGWDNFTIATNFARIESSVDLRGNPNVQDSIRPLQGQSPYLINSSLGYYNVESAFGATILYNVIGRRIREAGFLGYENVWEAPRNLIDLQISKTFLDKFELKATISDILNQSRDYYQDMDKNKVYNAEKDLLIERTNFGTTYSFALSYKF